MAEIKPFRGVRYNPDKVGGDISDALSPPYDIIDDEYQKKLYASSDYNFVRIDYNTAADRPAESVRTLGEWLESGVLVRDFKPSLYIMEETYHPPGGGKPLTRRGFFSALKLSDFGEGVVLPHERTLSGPKEERYALMKATKAHLSPVFLLFNDNEGKALEAMKTAAAKEPVSVAGFADVKIKLWREDNPEIIKAIQSVLDGKSLLVADGHHRYDTACRYKRENPADFEAINYGMIYSCPFQDPGLEIFPTHRAVHSVSAEKLAAFEPVVAENFEVSEISDYTGSHEDKVEALRKAMAPAGERPAVCMITPEGKAKLFVAKQSAMKTSKDLPGEKELRGLDVTALHELILNKGLGIDKEALAKKTNLDYIKADVKTIKEIEAGDKYQLAFFMRPTKLEQVIEVCEAKGIMPQKSTYFYPKLPTGLLFNLIDEKMI